MKKLIIGLLFCLATALFGCGGGGGTMQSQAPQTVQAVIKTSALSAAQNVAGIKLVFSLPGGVFPPLLSDGSVDVAKALVISSSAPQSQNLPLVSYKPGVSLTASAIVASGFSSSDTITINLKVAPGSFPVAGDFKLLSFEASDTNGAAITLTPTLSTTIQ